MKVLFFNISPSGAGGGRNQYVLDILARLRTRGVTTALVHGRHSIPEFRGTGYVFDHLGARGRATPDVQRRLEAILLDFEPDVIQLHDVANSALIPWLVGFAPTVRFVHNHELYCSGTAMTWGLPRRICEQPHGKTCFVRHVLRQCGNGNPFVNAMRFRNVTRDLAGLHGLDGIQVVSRVVRDNLVRNGIAPEMVTELPPYSPEPAMDKLPITTSRRMLLHPGGLVKNKGAWMLLDHLQDLPPDTELIFAGGGDQQAKVEQWVKRRGLGERVRIMGDLNASAWSGLFHQAALVLFPSRWNEPLGLPGLLAMAHGKPVVAFDAGGVPGWLEHDVTGLRVPFNDPRAFIRAVSGLLADPRRMNAMGRTARIQWHEKFQARHHLDALLDHYQKLAANRHTAPEEPPRPA